MAQTRTFDWNEDRRTLFINRHLKDLLPKPGFVRGYRVVKGTEMGKLTIKKGVMFTADGVRVEEDADLVNQLTVPQNSSGHPRIDRIVLYHCFQETAPAPAATYHIRQGTPAENPEPPAEQEHDHTAAFGYIESGASEYSTIVHTSRLHENARTIIVGDGKTTMGEYNGAHEIQDAIDALKDTGGIVRLCGQFSEFDTLKLRSLVTLEGGWLMWNDTSAPSIEFHTKTGTGTLSNVGGQCKLTDEGGGFSDFTTSYIVVLNGTEFPIGIVEILSDTEIILERTPPTEPTEVSYRLVALIACIDRLKFGLSDGTQEAPVKAIGGAAFFCDVSNCKVFTDDIPGFTATSPPYYLIDVEWGGENQVKDCKFVGPPSNKSCVGIKAGLSPDVKNCWGFAIFSAYAEGNTFSRVYSNSACKSFPMIVEHNTVGEHLLHEKKSYFVCTDLRMGWLANTANPGTNQLIMVEANNFKHASLFTEGDLVWVRGKLNAVSPGSAEFAKVASIDLGNNKVVLDRNLQWIKEVDAEESVYSIVSLVRRIRPDLSFREAIGQAPKLDFRYRLVGLEGTFRQHTTDASLGCGLPGGSQEHYIGGYLRPQEEGVITKGARDIRYVAAHRYSMGGIFPEGETQANAFQVVGTASPDDDVTARWPFIYEGQAYLIANPEYNPFAFLWVTSQIWPSNAYTPSFEVGDILLMCAGCKNESAPIGVVNKYRTHMSVYIWIMWSPKLI